MSHIYLTRENRIHLPLLASFTNSEMKAFRLCKRKHYNTYKLGYREIHKAGPLRFGTAMHQALEMWWSPLFLGILEPAMEAIDSSGEIDEYERAKARAMMIAYHAQWGNAQFEVLAVEAKFETELRHPNGQRVKLMGMIDAIIRLPNGDVWIVEHKTTGVECGFDSPYWKRLRIDSQVSTYYIGGRALGFDIKGCLYDVLRKPALKPSQIPLLDGDGLKQVIDTQGNRVRTKDGKKWRETADSSQGYTVVTRPETPSEFEDRCLDAIQADLNRFLVRGEVVRLEDDEKDFLEDLWATAHEFKDAENATRYPRNPDACEQWGRFCEYFDVCTGHVSLDDPTLFRRARSKHEELEQSTK